MMQIDALSWHALHIRTTPSAELTVKYTMMMMMEYDVQI